MTSLRAFEAAARHLNYERAGDELAVTASAIGQQIKTLEAWLRRPLFTRLPSKGVALTPLGQRYAASISPLLDQLDEATARALRPDTANVLTVSTMPSFALSWLIPRLGALKQRHPELEVRISVSLHLTDFLPRGCRHRGPLWRGRLYRPAFRAADDGDLLPRLQCGAPE
jgi:LysR family glycine cleavage system transcriptional activator